MTNRDSKCVAIFGGTSDIGMEIAEELGRQGTNLLLVGRNVENLQRVAVDLKLRYNVETAVYCCDFNDYPLIDKVWQQVAAAKPDSVVVTYGALGDSLQLRSDVDLETAFLNLNFVSVVRLLNLVANFFEQRKFGSIVVVTSVAGLRGRASNYAYGSAKAGLIAYCSGLRQRLFASGVQVLDVRPGFVDTKMTSAFKKGPIWVSPKIVALQIVAAMDGKKGILFSPRRWWWIMKVICSIPEFIFVRLKL